MASAAENFRSTCGPERGPPESSTQHSPAAAPQAGHGTADICSEVSSFLFIPTESDNTGRKTVQFCTLFVSAAFTFTCIVCATATPESIAGTSRAEGWNNSIPEMWSA